MKYMIFMKHNRPGISRDNGISSHRWLIWQAKSSSYLTSIMCFGLGHRFFCQKTTWKRTWARYSQKAWFSQNTKALAFLVKMVFLLLVGWFGKPIVVATWPLLMFLPRTSLFSSKNTFKICHSKRPQKSWFSGNTKALAFGVGMSFHQTDGRFR